MVSNVWEIFWPHPPGGIVVIQLSWLSGRALAAQARGISWVRLTTAAGLFNFLYICLITSKFIY